MTAHKVPLASRIAPSLTIAAIPGWIRRMSPAEIGRAAPVSRALKWTVHHPKVLRRGGTFRRELDARKTAGRSHRGSREDVTDETAGKIAIGDSRFMIRDVEFDFEFEMTDRECPR
jgi:hypothetical protein